MLKKLPILFYFISLLFFPHALFADNISNTTHMLSKKRLEKIPETHVVKKGDNLWNISKKYLNDPFLWPEIWNKNKYIVDPNLIFPGNIILFSLTKKEIVIKKTLPTQKTVPVKLGIPKPKATPPPQRVVVKPALVPLVSRNILDSSGFIAESVLMKGKIISSLDEKAIMGKDDLTYINIGENTGSAIGKKYRIYTQSKDIAHPVSKKKIGNVINIIGVLQVIQVQKKLSLAKIIYSFTEAEEGNRLMDYEETDLPMTDSKAPKTSKEIQGYIVASRENRIGLGTGDIVYIDNGLNSGVVPGDEFVAYRRRGKNAFKNLIAQHLLPKITIGEMKVIAVQGNTSTALITNSKQELEIGEKIEYKY